MKSKKVAGIDEPANQQRLLDLTECVRRRLAGRIRDFKLEIAEAGLVLRGNVSTYYAKLMAQQAVMEVTDVPIKANEIQVA